jgi:hypothetical protein
MDARVWFEKYLDNGIEHEYLVTEGYLWTGQFEEAEKILQTGGRPHSLEFDEKNNTLNAFWTKDCNGDNQFFIINEAVISKLCILGNDIEPCFEGSSLTNFNLNDESMVQSFSLDADFKRTMFSLIKEMQNILNEGGKTEMETEKNVNTSEETVVDYKKDDDKEKEEVKNEEKKEESTAPEKKEGEEKVDDKENSSDNSKASEKEEEDEDKKTKYNLDEIVEYVELKAQHEELKTKYSELSSSVESLTAENADLLKFKANIEKQEKEAMIKSFYMLSDADKKDVVDNIDKYSLSDIESKLSVICVRNKVSFKQDEEVATEDSASNPMTYNLKETLDSNVNENSDVPAWMRAVAKKQNIIQ